jgi:hypothetical protein
LNLLKLRQCSYEEDFVPYRFILSDEKITELSGSCGLCEDNTVQLTQEEAHEELVEETSPSGNSIYSVSP